jgi:hypothetical protein
MAFDTNCRIVPTAIAGMLKTLAVSVNRTMFYIVVFSVMSSMSYHGEQAFTSTLPTDVFSHAVKRLEIPLSWALGNCCVINFKHLLTRILDHVSMALS